MSEIVPDSRVAQVQVIPFRVLHGTWNVLMLLRNEAKGGFWQPVTGGVEPQETPMQAAKRELCEELSATEDDCEKWVNTGYTFQFTETFRGQERTLTEHVLGVVLQPDTHITLSKEHVAQSWSSYAGALALLKYNSNKKALAHYWPIVTGGSVDGDC